MEPNTKEQILEKLASSNNVLVTASSDPSVDQLAAVIGFTLFLNKIGKHATAVYSGKTPPTIEFLQPEATLEKNTDSLRDFIISLDKAKADKLRYKVEDKFVKIFITPYHTSISEKDLDYGHGDFNVDLVLTLGVNKKEDLDQAIMAHGRILHDATVVSVTASSQLAAEIGTIHWQNTEASSLCEMMVDLEQGMRVENGLDPQMSTAFLTGIVAETQRFRNEKTSSQTMNIAAILMAAGANQQLVALKLEDKPKAIHKKRDDEHDSLPKVVPIAKEPAKPDNGSISIDHPALDDPKPIPEERVSKPQEKVHDNGLDQIHIDEHGQIKRGKEIDIHQSLSSQRIETPGSSDLTKADDTKLFTANSRPEPDSPSTDPLSKPANSEPTSILTHNSSPAADAEPVIPTPEAEVDNFAEESAKPTIEEDIDEARDAVQKASNIAEENRPEPLTALNSQPLGAPLRDYGPPLPPIGEKVEPEPPKPHATPAVDSPHTTLNIQPPSAQSKPAPPPVPPPMMPPL